MSLKYTHSFVPIHMLEKNLLTLFQQLVEDVCDVFAQLIVKNFWILKVCLNFYEENASDSVSSDEFCLFEGRLVLSPPSPRWSCFVIASNTKGWKTARLDSCFPQKSQCCDFCDFFFGLTKTPPPPNTHIHTSC